MKIRKLITVVEDTHREIGKTINPPTRKCVAAAVIENPFANHYQQDLSDLISIGEQLVSCLAIKQSLPLESRPNK